MLLKFISVYLELGPKGEPCQPFCPVLLAITASPISLLAKPAATAQPEAVVPQSRGSGVVIPIAGIWKAGFSSPCLWQFRTQGQAMSLPRASLPFFSAPVPFCSTSLAPKQTVLWRCVECIKQCSRITWSPRCSHWTSVCFVLAQSLGYRHRLQGDGAAGTPCSKWPALGVLADVAQLHWLVSPCAFWALIKHAEFSGHVGAMFKMRFCGNDVKARC